MPKLCIYLNNSMHDGKQTCNTNFCKTLVKHFGANHLHGIPAHVFHGDNSTN